VTKSEALLVGWVVLVAFVATLAWLASMRR
jgi:hypothetical protein